MSLEAQTPTNQAEISVFQQTSTHFTHVRHHLQKKNDKTRVSWFFELYTMVFIISSSTLTHWHYVRGSLQQLLCAMQCNSCEEKNERPHCSHRSRHCRTVKDDVPSLLDSLNINVNVEFIHLQSPMAVT